VVPLSADAGWCFVGFIAYWSTARLVHVVLCCWNHNCRGGSLIGTQWKSCLRLNHSCYGINGEIIKSFCEVGSRGLGNSDILPCPRGVGGWRDRKRKISQLAAIPTWLRYAHPCIWPHSGRALSWLHAQLGEIWMQPQNTQGFCETTVCPLGSSSVSTTCRAERKQFPAALSFLKILCCGVHSAPVTTEEGKHLWRCTILTEWLG